MPTYDQRGHQNPAAGATQTGTQQPPPPGIQQTTPLPKDFGTTEAQKAGWTHLGLENPSSGWSPQTLAWLQRAREADPYGRIYVASDGRTYWAPSKAPQLTYQATPGGGPATWKLSAPGQDGTPGAGGPGSTGDESMPVENTTDQPFPENYNLPGYQQLQRDLEDQYRRTGRATPRLGAGTDVRTDADLRRAREGVAQRYRDSASGTGGFRGGQQELDDTLRGYTTAGLNDSEFTGDMRALVKGLGRQASGEDSLARGQVQDDVNRAIAMQRGYASGARPGSGALVARSAGQNIGNIGLEGASRSAREQLAERMEGTRALGGVLTTARGQDFARTQAERELRLAATGQRRQLLSEGRTQDLSSLAGEAGVYEGLSGDELRAELANQGNRTTRDIEGARLEQGANTAEDARIMELLRQRAVLSGAAREGTMGYEAELGRRLAAALGAPDDPSIWDRLGSAFTSLLTLGLYGNRNRATP